MILLLHDFFFFDILEKNAQSVLYRETRKNGQRFQGGKGPSHVAVTRECIIWYEKIVKTVGSKQKFEASSFYRVFYVLRLTRSQFKHFLIL